MSDSSAATRHPMAPFDALMYRSESDPHARSDMMAVFVLAAAPDFGRFVETIDRASRLIPALRQRVVDPPVPALLPVWAADPDFDLRYHVRRMHLPQPGTMQTLLDFLAPLVMSPLDRARPLWEFTLVEGLEDGRAAFVAKMNHAITDGLGARHYTEIIFDTEPEPAATPLPPIPAPVELTPRDLLGEALRHAPQSVVGSTYRLLRLGLRPRSLSSVSAFAQSLRRVLAPSPVAPSPLLRRRSLQRRLLTTEIDLADLGRAAKVAGGSINDGFLAAICGGLRRYHEKNGVPIEALNIAIPISLRTADDPAGGNRWAGARLAVPVAEPDPATRIKCIRALVLQARHEPAADALSLLAPVAARIPSALLALAAGSGLAVHDLQVSNVPGSPDPLYLAGVKVEQMYPFGPLPGPAAMIVLNSYRQTAYVGINLDPAAITDPELFATCLGQGVAEVLELAQPGPRNIATAPRRRATKTTPRAARR
ncbi:wax ester/triacylglycerol synthase family O-acyltransferase [Mycobacterium sp. M1]|uniref:Diacylglycerol O-acyltransferase n=1 Tax=Mycolicibacter acidiphilus TaxID=2835306 RepID=A0ABS5RLF9_9MYCO|nr:wax ester/triacylglycerol synthase family O-acyltransferase [Mycolicibacter acidiphilus]MBS9534429.1 wax ester/triacylglycerol synthase family O-acyltransferase [Mycolicibacter acidiphilus]